MKLNKIIYNKLVLQAEEAKNTNLTKLASGVLGGVGSFPRNESELFTYSENEYSSDVYNTLWKVALSSIKYYDLKSVDIQKIDDILIVIAEKIMQDLEDQLSNDCHSVVGPIEPKVFGQK